MGLADPFPLVPCLAWVRGMYGGSEVLGSDSLLGTLPVGPRSGAWHRCAVGDPSLAHSPPAFQIFCSRCSSHSAPLPRYGQVKPVRVCTHCYMFHVTPFYSDKAGI